jgi:hypothetical protein
MEVYRSVKQGRRVQIVSRNDECGSRVGEFAEQREYFVSPGRFEASGGFVRQDNSGIIYERAGDGGFLFIAAG